MKLRLHCRLAMAGPTSDRRSTVSHAGHAPSIATTGDGWTRNTSLVQGGA